MFLRFKPEGQAEQLLEFRPEKVLFARARIAEKVYSKLCGERRTWEQFRAEALTGSIAARKVALWLALGDTHPTLRFEDTPDFAAGDLTLEYSKEELRQMRSGLESADLIEAEKQAQMKGLEQAIAEAPAGSDEPDPEPDADVEDPTQEPGKDGSTGPSKSSTPSIGGTPRRTSTSRRTSGTD